MDVPALVARLAPYGLEDGEATVYFHLSRLGSARALDIANAAKRKRPDTYRLLDSLVRKGFAEKTVERPTQFLAVPIKVALARLIAVRHEQAEALAQSADALAEQWPRPVADAGPGQQRFSVFQGREQVHGLIRRMFAAAQDEITIVASPGGLANLGLVSFFTSLEGQAAAHVHVRVLTKPDAGKHQDLAALKGIAHVRHAELPSYHQMVIVDAQQIALFVSSGRKMSTQGDIQTVLWLNTPDFVLAQKALFDAVWSTALATEEWSRADKLGRLPNETRLLRGRWQRLDRLRRMVGHAKQSVHLQVPAEELRRWSRGGLARDLLAGAKAGVEITVWTDGAADLAGVNIRPAASPSVMACIVDGSQVLQVYGARDAGDAVAFEDEWSLWSTHPDAVAEAVSRLPAARALVS